MLYLFSIVIRSVVPFVYERMEKDLLPVSSLCVEVHCLIGVFADYHTFIR